AVDAQTLCHASTALVPETETPLHARSSTHVSSSSSRWLHRRRNPQTKKSVCLPEGCRCWCAESPLGWIRLPTLPGEACSRKRYPQTVVFCARARAIETPYEWLLPRHF